jgi:peptidoglycan/LPS O-acetylase OafA/YrhL
MKEATDNAFNNFWVTPYFPALDGLRAICLVLVIFNHMHEKIPPLIKGGLGVDIFFVLSGFLITTLLLREKEKYGSVSLKGFYTRRAFRILPVYFFVLSLYFPVTWMLHDQGRWNALLVALPYLVSFMQEFRPVTAIGVFGHSWSLGYEEKFYLLWPVLVLVLYPFRRPRILLLLLMGVAIVLAPGMYFSRAYGGLFFGSLLGVLLDRGSRNRIQPYFYYLNHWVALGAVIVTYFLFVLYHAPILLFSGMVTLLVATLVLRVGMVRSLLSHPLIVLMGKRSYAMYLVHVLVLNAAAAVARRGHVDNWYVVLPMTYFGSFTVATVLFYILEKPSIERGRALSAKFRNHLETRAPANAAKIEPIENPLNAPQSTTVD